MCLYGHCIVFSHNLYTVHAVDQYMVGAENMFPFQSEHHWKTTQTSGLLLHKIQGYFAQSSRLRRTKFEVSKKLLVAGRFSFARLLAIVDARHAKRNNSLLFVLTKRSHNLR